ncbi:MAG: ATP-binding cassette domain-containing protein [Bacteroidota bacterium]|jgi:phospholipid/cholesterol/gamma-HCH transport system ATP-binding protein
MIEVKNINKTFGEKHVLKNISANFEKGKCNFIIGASGGGKSVLMKCMVGLLKPESGEITFDKRDFVSMDYYQKKEVRKEIGMLFQGTALFDSLNVEDNIAFPLRMFTNWPEEQILERVNFCLSRVNLSNSNKLFPSKISGGQKKRVGIARAIALQPKYLFCDEPNSGLDPLTSRVIDYLIKEITEEYNITTIINTHDMKSLFEIGDNIAFIYQGQKWWEGNKEGIRDSGNVEFLTFMKASEF